MSKKRLFDEFSPVSAKQWKQKIQYDLKGADYNEALVWESPEGIKVKPFYHSDDEVNSSNNFSNSTGWKIGQAIYAGNAALANERAVKELERGAESLIFRIPSEDIKVEKLIKNIDLTKISVYLKMEFLSVAYVQSIVDFADNSIENVYLNIDPVGNLARTGNWFHNWEKDFSILKEILVGKAKNVLNIDLSLYQNAGANMAQQLAYGLAHANEYLNAFGDLKGEALAISFKVAVGTNYFFEIAKLRALRQLWQTLAAEYGVQLACHITVIPTKRNKTLYDYNTNMLRTTTECMSAVLGGADMISNLSYDSIYHKDNDFGSRIAMNQLLLLKNESYFDKVNNVADGSYYIENLTSQLAEKALVLFKSIEKNGGFLKQLKEHKLQEKIKESAAKEIALFNSGDEVLIGTNRYQNDKDKMKNEIEIYPFLKMKVRKTLIQPILEKRLAEEVEQKRLDDE